VDDRDPVGVRSVDLCNKKPPTEVDGLGAHRNGVR